MGDHGGSFTEVERKYDVDDGFARPALDRLPGVASVGRPPAQRLAATYFDTAGQALARAGVTLRRRTGGTDPGWHLKLPVSTDTRREVHAPLGRGAAAVPARLAALVAGRTGGEPLRPIARLATTRTLSLLTAADGQVLAEVADDLVRGSRPAGASGAGAAGTGWRPVARWREVEVELRAGPPSLLDAAGRLLIEAGARPAAAASKLSRLLNATMP